GIYCCGAARSRRSRPRRDAMRTIPASAPISPTNIPDVGSWLSGLIARARRFGSAWAARRQVAREAAMLYQLSEPELRDIGIVQADIAAIVTATYRRD